MLKTSQAFLMGSDHGCYLGNYILHIPNPLYQKPTICWYSFSFYNFRSIGSSLYVVKSEILI